MLPGSVGGGWGAGIQGHESRCSHHWFCTRAAGHEKAVHVHTRHGHVAGTAGTAGGQSGTSPAVMLRAAQSRVGILSASGSVLLVN